MKILFVSRESLPTYRADVAVLVERHLARRCQLSIVSEGRGTGEADYITVTVYSWLKKILGSNFSSSILKFIKTLHLSLKRDFDVIIIRDNAYFALFFALFSKVLGVRPVYWVSIMMGDLRCEDANVRSGYIRRLYARFYRFIEYKAFKRSSLLIAQSSAMEKYFRGLGCENIISIPMGVDEEEVGGFIGNKVTPGMIGYLGTVDYSRGTDVFLDVIADLKSSGRDVSLKIVGGSSDPEALEKLKLEVKRRSLNNAVICTGHVSRSEAWSELSECEVCISYIPRNFAFDLSSPTKLVEYLAMGKKVVANDIPDQVSLISDVGSGEICESTLKGIASAVARQMDLPPETSSVAIKENLLNIRGYKVLSEKLFDALSQEGNLL